MSSVIAVIIQIALIDIVFSLDSVITAVGMVNQIYIMVIAIIIAVMVMMLAVETVNSIINSHPSIKILALSFLLMVGFVLIADGLGLHVPKGYIYFAMAFSVFYRNDQYQDAQSKRRNLMVTKAAEDSR